MEWMGVTPLTVMATRAPAAHSMKVKDISVQIDMSKCMVSTIEWFHEMPNGTSKKIKTARTGDPHTHTIGKVCRARSHPHCTMCSLYSLTAFD